MKVILFLCFFVVISAQVLIVELADFEKVTKLQMKLVRLH